MAFLECFRCGCGRGCRSVFVGHCIPFCPLPFAHVLVHTMGVTCGLSMTKKCRHVDVRLLYGRNVSIHMCSGGVPSLTAKLTVSWL